MTAGNGRRRVVVGWLAPVLGLALVAIGCSTDANALDGSVRAPSAVAAVDLRPVPAVTIDLVSQGAEPRQPLALMPAVATVQRLTVTQAGRQSYRVDDEAETYTAPTMSISATLTMVGSSDGRNTVEVTFDSVTVDASNADETMGGQTRALVSGLEGATARLVIDASGRVIGEEPVLAAEERSESVILGWVDRNILTLADPLPTEPLGVGAEWLVSSSVPTVGVPAVATRRYRITEITETEVRAVVQRSVTWVAGNHSETMVLAGSVVAGPGVAVWPRNGIIGGVSYSLEGSISYALNGGTQLVQAISRDVSSSVTMLSVPAPPPTTTTTTEPAETDTTDTTGEAPLTQTPPIQTPLVQAPPTRNNQTQGQPQSSTTLPSTTLPAVAPGPPTTLPAVAPGPPTTVDPGQPAPVGELGRSG